MANPDTVTCEGCGATAVVADAPPDANPLPAGWRERVVDAPQLAQRQTAYRCPECSGE